MTTYYILWYPHGGTRYARGGYEFYPFTLDSLWPASALPKLKEKAERIDGWIEAVTQE